MRRARQSEIAKLAIFNKCLFSKCPILGPDHPFWGHFPILGLEFVGFLGSMLIFRSARFWAGRGPFFGFSMKSYLVLWLYCAILNVCFFSYVQWGASVLRRFFILHEVIPRLWLYCVILGVCFFSYVQWDALICVDLRFSMKSFHVLWKTRAILGVCFFSYVQWRASVLRA